MAILIKNVSCYQPRTGDLLENVQILVRDGLIAEVSQPNGKIPANGADIIDGRGKVAMPGLIDCHVHVFASEVNFDHLATVPLTLMTALAIEPLRRMLMRGFTTARDVGGADWGIRDAIAQGLLAGPRLFVAGAIISQTGGHGDPRSLRTQHAMGCACHSALSFASTVADGVPEVVKAVRDELRKGADHIKIMCSGGVASQSDPLESQQFRTDEIEAACDEATRWGTYVAAHAYSAESVRRAVVAGVRTIEHGNLIEAETAQTMAQYGAFLVPTLVTYESMDLRGKDYGMSDFSREKNRKILDRGHRSLELSQAAGVEIGFGTDLLGQLQDDQSREFLLRAETASAVDVLKSATITNARILRQEHVLGEIVPGAKADLLIADGNPADDLGLLQDQGAHLPFIMKDGLIFKNSL